MKRTVRKETAMTREDLGIYKFTVKEGNPSAVGAGDAPVWLKCEPMESELSFVDDRGFLSILLPNGTSLQEGHAIARYLEDHVTAIQLVTLR
jgi:hypothetical protein